MAGDTERFPLRNADSGALIFLFVMDLDCQDSLAERGSLHQSVGADQHAHMDNCATLARAQCERPGLQAGS